MTWPPGLLSEANAPSFLADGSLPQDLFPSFQPSCLELWVIRNLGAFLSLRVVASAFTLPEKFQTSREPLLRVPD